MNVFESIGETTDKATDVSEAYFKATHQYLRLKVFQQLTISVTMIMKLFTISLFVFTGLIFFAIAAAIAIGNTLSNILLGYLMVGVVFMLIGILIYIGRATINKIVIQKMSLKFFS